MRIRSVFLPLVLVACATGEPVVPPPSDTDTDPVTTEPDDDTAFPSADEGSLMLTRKLKANGTRSVQLSGLFVDEHSGFYNAANCAIQGGVCFDYLPPDEDDFVNIDPNRTFVPENSEFRYVGLDVALGDWVAPYVNGAHFPYYFADLTEQLGNDEIRGWFGVRFDGQWGLYEGKRDIYISPDIELIAPRPNRQISFTDKDTITLEWVPDGHGTILLNVAETSLTPTVLRMYMLEDDGHHELKVSELGLGTDPTTLNFRLSRWNFGSVEKRGHELEIVATSEVTFTGEYTYVEGRTDLEAMDKCLPARTMPAIEPGSYWGELADAGFKDDLWDSSACTNGQDADAPDAFVRVELEPLEFLSATYNLLDEDGTLWIVRDCTNALTCVSGADENAEKLPESASYFNNTDETQEVYLVLDADFSSTGIYHLDVNIDTLKEPDMYNTCPEVMTNGTALTTGSYYTSYLPYTGTVNPGNACTGTSPSGPESLSLVTVGAGETLTASINMAGGDPALYLMYNCNVPTSCAAGRDANLSAKETLVYTNNSGVSENLYLVVDTKGAGLRPYFLTIDIQ